MCICLVFLYNLYSHAVFHRRERGADGPFYNAFETGDLIGREEQLNVDVAVDIGAAIRSQKKTAFRQITRQRGKAFSIYEEFYGQPLDDSRMSSSFFIVSCEFLSCCHAGLPLDIVSYEIIKESILPE